LLPAGYEALMVEDDPEDDYWECGDLPTILSYVNDVAEGVAIRLGDGAPGYWVDYSQTTGSFYWMNHCEHCGAKLGDFETFQEFGVGFGPAGGKIRLLEMRESFFASCGSHSLGVYSPVERPESADDPTN
jgi:hypothetical protein